MNDMKIACIGWGSLIWEPKGLPVIGDWMNDGPMLPVEFGRESGGRRITLVICEGSRPVQTFWALMDVPGISTAITKLAEREKITKRISTDIGWWDASTDRSLGAGDGEIARWAKAQQLDGVVWTNLPCGFVGAREKMPSGAEIVAYLRKLAGQERKNAKEYVLNAPAQIDTAYRRLIADEMGWA